MLAFWRIRRFNTSTTAAIATILSSDINTSKTITTSVQNPVQSPICLDEPALVKLKAERDPDKLFNLFKANAHNRLLIENRFAFEDTVSRLAGAGRFDYIENLLEQQKALPQEMWW